MNSGLARLSLTLAVLALPAAPAFAGGGFGGGHGGGPSIGSMGQSNVPFDSTDSCLPGWPCHILGTATNPTTKVGPQGCKDWPDFPLCKQQAAQSAAPAATKNQQAPTR